MIWLLFSMLQYMNADKTSADWILYNGTVYTVDEGFHIAEAMVVKNGKILDTGSYEQILSAYTADKMTDLQGKFVYPGFIDPHCHFLGYGVDQSFAPLYGTGSFDEVIKIIRQHDISETGGWVIGRGWDQNDWAVKEFPDCKKLDSLFPEIPVYLVRIDGHAAIANTKALQLAGINAQTKINGGVVKTEGDKCTGLLIDNAMEPVQKILPINKKEFQENALLKAQQDCFAAGLTSVHDAGLDPWQINMIQDMQQQQKLRMRMYVMVSGCDSNLTYFSRKGRIKTDHLNVRSFKYYADGALGSRGAALLQEYSDDAGNKGLLFYSDDSLLQAAKRVYKCGFQMCTHAIGDAANHQVLDTYAKLLSGHNDLRWRIEHCQVVDEYDFTKFSAYSILPSIQATHATSDMYWAAERLGDQRIQNAYAYNRLLNEFGLIANGSDFPVENINPLYGFYAAVARKDQSGFPATGFQTENAITREQALRAMTIWAAYAAFEENEKGSLEKNKFADFVILKRDIMTLPEAEIFSQKIDMTVINGEIVYQK